jgi:hypothetical protein
MSTYLHLSGNAINSHTVPQGFINFVHTTSTTYYNSIAIEKISGVNRFQVNIDGK